MVLDPAGRIGTAIELQDRAAKKMSGRRIPIHGELRHRPGSLAAGDRGLRCGYSIRARRTNLSGRHRQLVRPRLPGSRLPRLQVATRAGGRSSPGPPSWFIGRAGRYEMCSCSPDTVRSLRPNGTSTATVTPSASWCRSSEMRRLTTRKPSRAKRTRRANLGSAAAAIDHAVILIDSVCVLAGSEKLIGATDQERTRLQQGNRDPRHLLRFTNTSWRRSRFRA